MHPIINALSKFLVISYTTIGIITHIFVATSALAKVQWYEFQATRKLTACIDKRYCKNKVAVKNNIKTNIIIHVILCTRYTILLYCRVKKIFTVKYAIVKAKIFYYLRTILDIVYD